MRRLLDAAKNRATDAEKELKRLRLQLREVRENLEQAVIKANRQEALYLEAARDLERCEKREARCMEKIRINDQLLAEADRREQEGLDQIARLEERMALQEKEHAAEIRQLHHELDISWLKTDVEFAKLEIKRIDNVVSDKNKGVLGRLAKVIKPTSPKGAGAAASAHAGSNGSTSSSSKGTDGALSVEKARKAMTEQGECKQS